MLGAARNVPSFHSAAPRTSITRRSRLAASCLASTYGIVCSLPFRACHSARKSRPPHAVTRSRPIRHNPCRARERRFSSSASEYEVAVVGKERARPRDERRAGRNVEHLREGGRRRIPPWNARRSLAFRPRSLARTSRGRVCGKLGHRRRRRRTVAIHCLHRREILRRLGLSGQHLGHEIDLRRRSEMPSSQFAHSRASSRESRRAPCRTPSRRRARARAAGSREGRDSACNDRKSDACHRVHRAANVRRTLEQDRVGRRRQRT